MVTLPPGENGPSPGFTGRIMASIHRLRVSAVGHAMERLRDQGWRFVRTPDRNGVRVALPNEACLVLQNEAAAAEWLDAMEATAEHLAAQALQEPGVPWAIPAVPEAATRHLCPACGAEHEIGGTP